MTIVSQQSIDDACLALRVLDQGPIGAPAGQKAVRRVDRNGEQLVLKIIEMTTAAPATIKRAEREVELLESLASPHVVKVVSNLVTMGTPVRGVAWLEEYLDGEDLGPLLGRPWSWTDTALMGLHVARGLAVAHAQGVIHRDLSPNNVRRLSSGSYKVMDFGFAHFTLKSGVTVAGQPGTPGYMSPEHFNAYSGGPIPASDVFEVGLLIYQALTGNNATPFSGDEPDYFRRLTNWTVPDIKAARPDLAPDQAGIVLRCLHPQPARRYVDAGQLVIALESLS